MIILDVKQGSDEWLNARLKYLCASEAPAMMGESKFMTRNQLLAMKKGWQSNPVGAFKKKLFNKGHENEDSARELFEIEICGDMPAAVGLTSIDHLDLLSSFDGYSESQEIQIWEHKTWNSVLAENVRNNVIEPAYYWQLEHQMLTAGANQAVFMVSDGTIENRLSMIYTSVPDRRKSLINGWKQFVKDLDQYQIKARREVVVATDKTDFPTIECRVEGSTVVSNLGDYIPIIQKLANDQMNIILDSDQDFADKDFFNKNVKKARALLKTKSSEVENAFESLSKFNIFVSEADLILQKLQSHGERQVNECKKQKKNQIINSAKSCINKHIEQLSKTIDGLQMHDEATDWNSIIKGKRNLEKMQEAVDCEISKIKIKLNSNALIIRKNLDSFKDLAGQHKFLFLDYAELVTKDNEDLVNLINIRISNHDAEEDARIEEQRKKIQDDADSKIRHAEEQAKIAIDNEVRQKDAAELRAKQAEERIDREEIAEEKDRLEQIRIVDEQNLADIVAKERREADVKNISKIRGEAEQCLIDMHNITEKLAKQIVMSIHYDKIKNITIGY